MANDSDDDVDIDVLAALGLLELEMAAAYERSARYLPRQARAQMVTLLDDHLLHVRRLSDLVLAFDGEPLPTVTDEVEDSAMLELVDALGAEGPQTLITALLASERLTDATYQNVLALELARETRAVVQRNYEEEQRHHGTLSALAKMRALDEDARR